MIEGLKQIPGIEVSDDTATKAAHNSTYRGQHPGADYLAVVTAATLEGLSDLLKYCVKNDIKIITRSGGTALTGGSSVSKLRGQKSIILKLYYPDQIKPPEILDNGRVRIYPGNTTLQLNKLLKPLNRIVTVDLGIGDVKGEAQILGYLATDAAGSGAAFKGRSIDIIESIKVMTLDGKVQDLQPASPLITDFAGMGGTTGIIVEAVINTGELPKTRQVAAIRIESISQMYDLLEAFKKHAWEKMNLFERINPELFAEIVEFTSRQDAPETKQINQLGNGDILLIELTSTEENADLVTPLKTALTQANLLDSTIITKDGTQGEFLLSYRVVNASRACDNYAKKTGGEVIAFDISVPIGDDQDFPSSQLTGVLKQRIPGIKIFSFGHAAGVEKISATTKRGGTAIHFNPVVPATTTEDQKNWVREAVFQEVSERGGNIVSEHTPGTKLVSYLKKFKPEQYQAYLKTIAHYNPAGILNPGAFVLAEDLKHFFT